MKFTNPETGRVYEGEFTGFVVFSDRKTFWNPMNYMVLVCLHHDYEVAKKVYESEIEKHKTDEFQEESKSVKMILRTGVYFGMEGLIVHKWDNYNEPPVE